MKNLLVGTDGSDGAGRAVDVAAKFARAAGAKLTIAMVGTPLSPLANEMEEILVAEELSRAERRARRTKGISIKTKILWGDPAQALIKAIRSEKVDAIVVGRRGRGRLAGVPLGSVSQKLISVAPCVVIITP
jgi:nucleotide-binding universal stress UspA family protein